jgi:hypothetical protein
MSGRSGEVVGHAALAHYQSHGHDRFVPGDEYESAQLAVSKRP